MKVAFVTNYYRPEYGDRNSNTCKALAELGVEVTLFASKYVPPARQHPTQFISKGDLNYKVRNLPAAFTIRYVNLGPLIPTLYFELMRGNFDVIDCGCIYQINTLISVLAKKAKGIPLVVTSDINPPEDRFERLMRPFQEKTLFKYVVREADYLISRHRKNMGYLEKVGGNNVLSKLKLIPGGVDLELFAPNSRSGREMRKRLNISEDSFVILTISNLTINKGILDILGVMPEIVRRVPNVKFVFIGRGPLKECLFDFVNRKRIRKFVVQKDYIFYRELPGVYNMADVFVILSRREAAVGPGTLFQAMSCGRPVITTDISDVSDYVKNYKNGLLVEIGDKKSLLKRILELYHNDDLAKRLSSCARSAVKKLDWKNVAKKTKEIYEKAIGLAN